MARSANYNLIVRAVRRASRPLLRDFAEIQHLQSARNAPADFAERAESFAESQLRDELTEARPNYGWASPRLGQRDGNDPTRRWIVRPVCSWNNFLHGIPHWAISIALEHKGSVVTAVLFDAFRNEMFGAEKGNGSWLDNKRIRASSRTKPDSMLAATDFSALTDKESACQRIMASRKFRSLVASGSPALDLAYVGAGRLDCFWMGEIDECEIAAGMLVLTEAGALAEISGGNEGSGTAGSLLAASSEAFDMVSKLLQTR